MGHRIDRLCLFEHRNDDKWNTVIFLWAGLAPIVDVESFIEQCIEIQQWDLAYGIIYDQYDRFSGELLRIFLLKIITSDVNIDDCYKLHYDCYGPRIFAESSNFMFKSFVLRNLQQSIITFKNLLQKCVGDDLIQ